MPGQATRCRMPGCGAEAVYTQLELCTNCYQYLWRYSKMTPRKILSRQDQLALFQTRLEAVMPTNVKRIKRKKRKAA